MAERLAEGSWPQPVAQLNLPLWEDRSAIRHAILAECSRVPCQPSFSRCRETQRRQGDQKPPPGQEGLFPEFYAEEQGT
jgi:hypothetical protein